jgi:RNA polymerase sigma-B factor
VAISRQTDPETSTTLLRRASTQDDPVERTRLQDEVVLLHIGLARAIAARYRGRGIAEDDLFQAAAMALLKAARSFDPARGTPFLSYAVVTMTGEVKRQFRDFGWMVRPPRSVQNLQSEVSRAQRELTQQLGRSPRVREVAGHLDVPEEQVLEALAADGCFHPASLDTPVAGPGSAPLGDLIGDHDRALTQAETRAMLAPAVRALPETERRVLYLRFFREWTQSQIAREIGTTQMQVSRILSRMLAVLHDQLL